MQRETAIGLVLLLLILLALGAAAPVVADSLLHARSVVAEAQP